MQDPTLQFLRALVAHGENRYCFDCHQRGPTYVNITIGSFICTTCSGALRKYNHRVKSISMSNFSQSEIDFLCTRGNKACRKIYLALSDDQTMTEKDLKDSALDDFLRQKYQLQKWYREPTSQIETEALKENRELLEQAEKNMNQKGNRSTCGNAAAGLIVLPTRLNATTSQTSLTSGTTQSGSINGENTIPQQSIPNHLVSSQKQDAFSSQSKNNADPFAAFTPSNFSSAPNFTVAKTDLFANFSPKVPASTNSNVTTQLFPNVNSTSSSMFSNSSINTATNLYGSNSGDKYAALAELDGLFKSTGIKTSNSDSLEKQIDDNIVTKANISIVNASQWVTSFTPQISYPNIPVVGTHGWPTSTPFQDNAQSLNPFLSSASGVQNPGVFNRFPNPFASYPVMTTPSNVHQFPEPVSLANPESRNPFLSNPPQSFTMNPFSGSTNSTSISYPQSATNSFSPVIHPVSSFPAKMNNPMNGIVGQLGTTGFLDNNGDADRSQMSSFNPF